MKYTFINGEKQQTVEIPDEVIKKHKRSLGCTTSEAINLFLFDEGYIDNDEVTKLTNKAKANGAGKVKIGCKQRKSPSRKPDEAKRTLIQSFYQYLVSGQVSDALGVEVQEVEVANQERIITFAIGDDNYEITLSKKRKAKA